MKESQFPDWYTIDEIGLSSLSYFLMEEFKGKTVLISIKEEDIK